jgi:CBS domain-containing protein
MLYWRGSKALRFTTFNCTSSAVGRGWSANRARRLPNCAWRLPGQPVHFCLRSFSGFVFLLFKYLLAANLTLAMFNLLPGLPLDGGRVLRAWLWHRRGDIVSATRTAKRFGVAIAYMLISYGIFLIVYDGVRGRLSQDFLAAAWLLLVGVFLMNAAEQDYRIRVFQQAEEQQQAARWKIAGTVGSVMRTPPVSVLPDLKVSEFIDRILTKHRQTGFPVARDGRLHGMLLLQRLREVPKEKWEQVIVRDVMEPIDESHFVTVRASIDHATRKLKSNQIGQLAVIDGEGILVGYLCETDLSVSV